MTALLVLAAFILGALAHEADRRRNAELDADACAHLWTGSPLDGWWCVRCGERDIDP